MKRGQIIATLKAAEPELRKRGIRHAALFGSIARGEERPDSDIDILVEWPVDVIDRNALKPHLRAPAARDTVYAF
jgi:uncharacterized protein